MGWRYRVVYLSVRENNWKKKIDRDNFGRVGNKDWLKYWGFVFESLLIK